MQEVEGWSLPKMFQGIHEFVRDFFPNALQKASCSCGTAVGCVEFLPPERKHAVCDVLDCINDICSKRPEPYVSEVSSRKTYQQVNDTLHYLGRQALEHTVAPKVYGSRQASSGGETASKRKVCIKEAMPSLHSSDCSCAAPTCKLEFELSFACCQLAVRRRACQVLTVVFTHWLNFNSSVRSRLSLHVSTSCCELDPVCIWVRGPLSSWSFCDSLPVSRPA